MTPIEVQPPSPGRSPDSVRDEFPILDRKNYLNSCSLGALSTRAEGYLDEFRERWHEYGASAWYELWMGRIADLRGRMADFLGADASEIALHPSTSTALSVISESVSDRVDAGRNRVVCTELDFPTLAYQWAVKPEIDLVVLKSEDGVGVDPEQFAEAVDERTLFLATSHVFFTTGYAQDIESLGRIARDAGAISIIDGYQGAGQIPVDVRDCGVDIYTTGPLKWLCGGPGLAYLYVRGGLIGQLEPRIMSWWAHARPFDFDLEHFDFQADARRFEMGTPSLPTIHTALGAQELIDEVGIEAVARRNRTLTTRLVERLRDEGFGLTISDDPARRTAIVMVRHEDAPGAVDHLAERDIVVDHRSGHVRVSPHFYNRPEEIDRFVEALVGYPTST